MDETISAIDTIVLRTPLDIWAPPPMSQGVPRTHAKSLYVRGRGGLGRFVRHGASHERCRGRQLDQAGRILMEDVPFAPLYTLAELYGVQRNVIWKGSPDNKILAVEMKIRG